jgi:hypothetical protein
LKDRDYMKACCVDGRKTLRWVLKKVAVWIGFIWLRTETKCQALVNTGINLCIQFLG